LNVNIYYFEYRSPGSVSSRR